MAVQTHSDYQTDHGQAYAGMPVYAQGNKIISRVAEEEIAFGFGCTRGAASRSTKVVDAASQDFLGVAVRTLEKEADGSEVIAYRDEQEVALLNEGEVWVVVDETVAEGDPVFVLHTSGGTGAGIVGTFRTDADTARAQSVAGAQFESIATVGNLAKISIPSALRQ